MLTEAPVLTQLEYRKEFIVYSNALLSGLGCISVQEANVVAAALSRNILFALIALNKHLMLESDGSILVELFAFDIEQEECDLEGKLSPRRIGLYEVLQRIGPVVYRLALPLELKKIHNMFHVSMLHRYHFDPSHVISLSEIELQPDLTYSEELVKILAREVKEMRNKWIDIVKVLWHRHCIEEATWELEETLRSQYPNLFSSKIFKYDNSKRGGEL
ncbi:receptor-like protein kinase [Gossypium australe]|uniref:Receptor-like protein kinase n=1 Tax=Gossypium australe TaxID=47621 RepID=A0A5B6WHC4_9ROSI|nr:receptor-like protein kinase [Gossypium australe]